jgi:polysaccharide export outer membrane protein
MRRLVLIGLALALFAACTDRPVAPYPKSDVAPPSDAAFGPGDIFDVRVYDEPTLSNTYQVAPDGTIDFPLIDRVKVQGMTPSQVEQDLQKRLADGYLKNPHVSVLPKEYRSKKVRVFGQVRSPGTFAFTENMSIVEAITRAGGFTALAKKNSVKVTRSADSNPDSNQKVRVIFVAVDDIGRGKAPDFLLRPGDTVFVDERPF